MENKSHAIIAVTFLIVFLGGVAMAWYWLSHREPEPRRYKIITTQAVSVEAKSPVKFKGITVGHVQSVHFDVHNRAKVDIVFSVHKNTLVTQSTYAVMEMQGLTGGDALVLKLGEGSRAPLPTRHNHLPLITLRPSLLDRLKKEGMEDVHDIGKIIASVQRMLNAKTRHHVQQSLAQIDTATRKIVALENHLMPLAQRLPQLAHALQQAVSQSQALLAQATTLAHSAHGTVQAIQRRTLPDIDQLSESLRKTSQSINALAAQLQANPQSLIFGKGAPKSGPGEPHFHPPATGDYQ